ncbi:hypothetical protein AB0C10_37445 [Microbispora amethystogenes]
MNVHGLIAALAIAALLGPIEALLRLDARRRASRTTNDDNGRREQP